MTEQILFIEASILLVNLLLGLFQWWLFYGLECYMNGDMGGVLPMHIRCLWQDVKWLLPSNRAKYIKEMIAEGNGAICGNPSLTRILYNFWFVNEKDSEQYLPRYSWTYQEIREKNLYQKVGNNVLPGIGHFVMIHILCPVVPFLVTFGIIICINKWLT